MYAGFPSQIEMRNDHWHSLICFASIVMMAKQELNTALAEILRIKKNYTKRVKKTPRFFLGVSSFVIQTVMSILSLSNMSFDMAVDWLMDTKRKGMQVPP